MRNLIVLNVLNGLDSSLYIFITINHYKLLNSKKKMKLLNIHKKGLKRI